MSGLGNLEFLKAAQLYARDRDEELWFTEAYAGFREFMGVRASANQALFNLYGTDCYLVEGFE